VEKVFSNNQMLPLNVLGAPSTALVHSRKRGMRKEKLDEEKTQPSVFFFFVMRRVLVSSLFGASRSSSHLLSARAISSSKFLLADSSTVAAPKTVGQPSPAPFKLHDDYLTVRVGSDEHGAKFHLFLAFP
jgi:hypothetical protein